MAEKPIRIFHGTPDNYNPVASCKAFVTRLKNAKRDVELAEYPNAPHGFDNPLGSVPAAVAKDDPISARLHYPRGRRWHPRQHCYERTLHVPRCVRETRSARRRRCRGQKRPASMRQFPQIYISSWTANVRIWVRGCTASMRRRRGWLPLPASASASLQFIQPLLQLAQLLGFKPRSQPVEHVGANPRLLAERRSCRPCSCGSSAPARGNAPGSTSPGEAGSIRRPTLPGRVPRRRRLRLDFAQCGSLPFPEQRRPRNGRRVKAAGRSAERPA